MTVRARLYDANGEDRDVELTTKKVDEIDDKRLLWIDLDDRSDEDLGIIAAALELETRLVEQLGTDTRRSKLIRFPKRVLVTLGSLERDGEEIARRELDVLVGQNVVVTVHDGRLAAIDDFEEQLQDESGLGELQAGAFMTGLVDAVITTYFREIDRIERDIEALDQVALRLPRGDDDFLSAVVALRHRIAVVRRALTPNRDALSPIVRPDFEVHRDLVRAWPGTIDRLERAIDGVDKARELLVGSFDIYLGRSAQRSNDVMKTLTIVSAIALPAIVLAGVMGMNFGLPIFDQPENFYVVVASMVGLALAILTVSRWRSWI